MLVSLRLGSRFRHQILVAGGFNPKQVRTLQLCALREPFFSERTKLLSGKGAAERKELSKQETAGKIKASCYSKPIIIVKA
jgi:hypothetical protein